jgi:hypothetical protein
MRADLRYNQETGDITCRVEPEQEAERAVLAALADRKVQPVLISTKAGNAYYHGISFTLKLIKPAKAAKS